MHFLLLPPYGLYELDYIFILINVFTQYILRWQKIAEVRQGNDLIKYLKEKQSEGFVLVGVEQTAQSVTLDEYKFNSKTVLILGNEKEGIPIDVLDILDVCVEIPQSGRIRSFNVHVTGALVLWEYVRQARQMANKSA